MKKDKKPEEINKNMEATVVDVGEGQLDEKVGNNDVKDIDPEMDKQLEALKAQVEEKTKKSEEHFNLFQRTLAEFENYKKRTTKEKENLCSDVISDVVSAFLPVVDNMERAIQASSKEEDKKSLLEGIEMVFRQFKEVMKNLGVEEIKCVGEKFDPQLHNAVMHVEDENQDESVVVEEFQKGYMIREKVVRHSMVKVAN